MIESKSSLIGLMKIATLSAYKEVLHMVMTKGSGERMSCVVAMSSRCCSGSIASINTWAIDACLVGPLSFD